MADELVLAAQRWVNSTYGTLSGYFPVVENGKTSWSTMYALTRGLQYELGISPQSDSFGPGTLAALTRRGNISAAELNRNIVKIVQYGCYCKGYDAGGSSGVYDGFTGRAIDKLTTDIGLGAVADQSLRPKVFKALLSMEAAVILGGGRDVVRTIQQWMNGRYYGRANFYVVPTDGLFSRNVQKALLLAIQFELGLSDSQATGTFGPTTQEGLRTRANIGLGSTDSSTQFVHLYRAALEFNGSDFGAGFGGTFDENVRDRTRSFQVFTHLDANGRGDYRTWAELLVSTGDATRAGSALDTIDEITAPRAEAMKQAGYYTVGRYLTNVNVPGALNKKLQPGEVQTILGAGLTLFPLFQRSGESVEEFTYTKGFQHAREAHTAALGYGFGPGTTLYFAVDYDAVQEEIDLFIVPYFLGIAAGLRSLGTRYAHGVYGSRNVCTNVTKFTYARFSFVSGMSTGYSGNLGYPLPRNWSFNQIQKTSVGSGSTFFYVDKVVVSGVDKGVSQSSIPRTVQEFLSYFNCIFDTAFEFMAGDPLQVNRASVLTLRYLRLIDYNGIFFRSGVGDADSSFTDAADRALASIGFQNRMPTFVDPITFDEIKISHWAVSMEYVLNYPSQTGEPVVNLGDLGGWGGDLLTLFDSYWEVKDNNADAYRWVVDNFGRTSVDNSFNNRNLIEDVDGFNLARIILDSPNLRTAVNAYYQPGGGATSRFGTFVAVRFGDRQETIRLSAESALTGPLFVTARAALTESLPNVLAEAIHQDKIEAFCAGFADAFLVRKGQE